MKHIFDVSVAEKLGIYEAVILENLYYWTKKNEANERHYHDGKYWTYNSRKAFAKLFPYIGERTLDRVLNNLVSNEILLKGDFNEDRFDRTMWYAFTDKGESLMSETVDFTDTDKMTESSRPKWSHREDENGQCIINNNTDNKHTDNKPKRTKESTNSTYESILNESGLDESVIPVVWDFIKMRKLIKSPLTDKGLSMMINKLMKMDSTPEGQIAILEQSVMNSWKGIFAVQGERMADKGHGNGRDDVTFAIIDSWGDDK